MKNDIVKEIWEIGGLINYAIDNKDIFIYEKARKRFNKLMEKKEYLKTIASASIDREYDTYDEFDYDREINFSLLAFEVGKAHDDIVEKNNETHDIVCNSILEILWYTRITYDFYVDSIATGEINEHTDTAYGTVTHNLNFCLDYLKSCRGYRSTLYERMTLQAIYDEFVSTYAQIQECNN